MFFTQEDYRKIEKWLLANSVKDTEFAGASLPLKGNETVAFVQNGKNVNVLLKDLIEQIFLLGVSDFLNVTDKYGESRISLTQAIQLIPYKSRKIGQVITFLDEDGEWKLFQFQGERVNQWNNATLWVDLIERIQGISIIDSEDITATVDNLNQTSLTFADKNYNTTDYSGLGRVYLRKNIQTVVNPNTGITYSTNLLTQQMLNKENTIYVLQYDYSLNYQTISIPEGSILVFEGGDINNGTLNCNSTIIVGKFRGNATIAGTYSFQDAQADEEDITQSQSSVLKFKNKGYDEANFSGLGRTYLRKNIVNGVNVLTQDMINNPNTIYHIQYDYNLNGQTITIPEGCVLLFEGGSVSNGTLIGTNTIISSTPTNILSKVNIQGTYNNEFWYIEWIAENGSNDYSSAMQTLFYDLNFPKTVKLIQDVYVVKSPIQIGSNLVIEGNNSTIKSEFEDYYDYIFTLSGVENTVIRNLVVNQSEIQDCSKNLNPSGTALVHRAQVIRALNLKDVTIENCSFYYFGASCIAVDSSTKPEGTFRLSNSNFYFRRGNANYDSSTVYAACTTNIITGNYINGAHSVDDSSKATTPSFGGIEVHGPDTILSNNNIIKCGNAINVTPGDNYGDFTYWRGVTISNNVIGSCGKGIMYWCFGGAGEVDNRTWNVNITGNTLEIGGAGNGSTALNAIGIVSSGTNGTLHNVNVIGNIINYISVGAYHKTINVAPGINFSGDNELTTLNIKDNIISNSPANAIVINHDENHIGKNITIEGNTIVNCHWRDNQSIPNADSYHYPISITYCDGVIINDNKFFYDINYTTNTYGLYYIHNSKNVTVLGNIHENPNGDLGGINTDNIQEIYTDDMVTMAQYYKTYPKSFKHQPIISYELDNQQLLMGDKILDSNDKYKIAIDTYVNANDRIFKGSTVGNSRIIWVNRIPAMLKAGLVVSINNIEAGLDGEYVVSMVSKTSNAIHLYNVVNTVNGASITLIGYQGDLINEDGTIPSKVVII